MEHSFPLKMFARYFSLCCAVALCCSFAQVTFGQSKVTSHTSSATKFRIDNHIRQLKVVTTKLKTKQTTAQKSFADIIPNSLLGNSYYVNDGSTTGDHYTLTTGNDLFPGTAASPFATIQHAVDMASPGDTIYVDAGTYSENVIVDKSDLAICGSNYTTNPNTATRAAESVIQPSVSDPDYTNSYSVVVSLDGNQNNITIDGFTIDGNNPNLTSDSTVNGVDVDANDAISGFGDISGIIVTNNIIKNFNYTGIDIYPSGSVSLEGNTLSDNKLDNVDGYYSVGILIYNNFYADIKNNVLTRQNVGIQTGNFNLAKPSAGNSSISNNSVASEVLGIWHNLAYQSASTFDISGNTLTSSTGATINEGIEISSIQQTVAVNVSNNHITGARVGIDLWNNPTTSAITIQGGTVSNCSIGLFPNNYDGYNSNAASSAYSFSGVTVTGCDTGMWVRDNVLNSNNATVAATISNATSFAGSSVGLLLEGANASASFSGSTPASFSGQSVYIKQKTNGNNVPSTDIDATAVNFGGSTGATMSQANLFVTENKLIHKMDNLALGFVTVKANNDFVTATSGTVQRGVDIASPGWTENVGAGTYSESVIVNKSIVIKGLKAGVLAKGRTGAESIIDPNSSTSHGFNIQTDNVTIDGFTITNSAAYPSSNSERYGVVTITKNGSGNFTNISVKNNLISRQFKAIDFNATDNFEISSNWLHGENDAYNYGCTWIASYGTSSSNGLITNNDLDGYSSAVEIQGNASQPVSNLMVSENRSAGSQYVFIGCQNSTIYRNSVLNVTTGSHVFIGGGCTGDTFTENFFDTGSSNGFSISNDFGAGVNSNLTINYNSITGHANPAKYEIKIAPSSYTGTLNAECNWFGTANANAIAQKISGPVDYKPYLTNGTDNNTAPGFQPVPNSCNGTPIAVTLDSVKNVVCFGSATGAVYISVSGGVSPYTYNWSNGTTTQDLTNVTSGTYKVIVTDNVGQTDSVSATVNETSTKLTVNAVPGTIQCQGGTTTVAVSASGGATPYSGVGVFTATSGSHTYTVTDANGCTASKTITIQDGTGTAPNTPGPITGDTYNLCGGGNHTYSVAVVPHANSYHWTVPQGFTVQNNGSRTVTITVPSNFSGSAQIKVAATNTCGASPKRSLIVYAIAPNPTTYIQGPSSVAPKQANVIYSLPFGPNLVYTWKAPIGASITEGQGTSQIKVKFGTKSGKITVHTSNACGNSPTGSKAVTVGNQLSADVTEDLQQVKAETTLSAYPNPTKSVINVVFSSSKTVQYQLYVTDVNGKQLLQRTGTAWAGENNIKIDLSKYANGMYLLKLITDNEERTLKLLKAE